jgi:hypothetical protein
MQTHGNLQAAEHAIGWTLDQQRHEARRLGARIPPLWLLGRR